MNGRRRPVLANKSILAKGIEEWPIPFLLLNQIGSVTETLETIERPIRIRLALFRTAAEAVGSFIADLAVAVNAGHIKTGADAAGNGLKIQQLMRIEYELGKVSHFAGKAFKRLNPFSEPITTGILCLNTKRIPVGCNNDPFR